MSEYKPSDFAELGNPSCSRWGKSEIEWIALAYVQALANDGDTWKKLTQQQTYDLLTDEQKKDTYEWLFREDEYYTHWFEMVSGRITDSDGALSVGGFWNTMRLERAAPGKSESHK